MTQGRLDCSRIRVVSGSGETWAGVHTATLHVLEGGGALPVDGLKVDMCAPSPAFRNWGNGHWPGGV